MSSNWNSLVDLSNLPTAGQGHRKLKQVEEKSVLKWMPTADQGSRQLKQEEGTFALNWSPGSYTAARESKDKQITVDFEQSAHPWW